MTVTSGREAVTRILHDHPRFHGQGTITWYATRGTLDFLARTVRPGDRTLETGTGASTVVFAAAGAEHTAISPSALEHELIAKYCAEIDIDTSRVTFVARPSDDVLPGLDPEVEFDLVFIDGAHSFPFPIVDWHYAARRLKVGGCLVLDDVPIPAVSVVHRALSGDPAWEFVEWLDRRAAAFRKRAQPETEDYWRFQSFNRRLDFSTLPPRERLRAEWKHGLRRAFKAVDGRWPAAGDALRKVRGRVGGAEPPVGEGD